jgi:hypothetical protein
VLFGSPQSLPTQLLAVMGARARAMLDENFTRRQTLERAGATFSKRVE